MSMGIIMMHDDMSMGSMMYEIMGSIMMHDDMSMGSMMYEIMGSIISSMMI